MRFITATLAIVLCLPLAAQPQPQTTNDTIAKTQDQVRELEELLRGGVQLPPQQLQWNRYETKNFEILSLDDAQGRYLYDNIEFIKTWILWRWGMKDVDLPDGGKCKVVAVPNKELYSQLFNRSSPTWRTESKNGKTYGTIWLITDEVKWNTAIPTQLTEVVLANFEDNYKVKFPVWCRRGMTVLNSRFSDIRSTFTSTCDTKNLLEMTQERYTQLNEAQRKVYDSQATVFCLWVKQEFGGKLFLDAVSGGMTSPQMTLQLIGQVSYSDVDLRLKEYQPKLANAPDYYLTW
jgi:hypothetical protein